jgi:hypothetical protein
VQFRLSDPFVSFVIFVVREIQVIMSSSPHVPLKSDKPTLQDCISLEGVE